MSISLQFKAARLAAVSFKSGDDPRDWGCLMVQGNKERASIHRIDGSFTQAPHRLLSGSANTALQDIVPWSAGINCCCTMRSLT